MRFSEYIKDKIFYLSVSAAAIALIGYSIALTSAIIVLIYGGYFMVTYFTSRRMIKG